MDVHLVDGTYELFRYHFAPNNRDLDRGATIGVVGTLLQLVDDGATHVGVATDHVIESFRNDLWAGYKSSAGMPRELLAQFPLVEAAMEMAGFTVWPQVDFEADDGMAAAAVMAAADPRVERVIICTPDKDLGQCVGGKVVQLDRRKGVVFDAAGVEERLGVPPASIPDLLALVGDSADGFPGLPGWGAKSAAAVLRRWGHLEDIPADPTTWDAGVRGAAKLNADAARAVRAGPAVPPHRHRRDRRPGERDASTSCAGPARPTPTAFAELCDGARRPPPGRAGDPAGGGPRLTGRARRITRWGR